VLDAIDLTPRIGSAIDLDADTLLAGTRAAEIRDLLVERGVVVMRGAHFTDDQQRAFTHTMGELRLGTVYEQENAGMLKISHLAGTYFWHMDGTYDEVPPFASILSARAVPPSGGETEFANTQAAYDDLPGDEKERLAPLEVEHSMRTSMDRAYDEPTIEQIAMWMTYRRRQPLVWQRTSGRRSLVIGSTASYVVGMHPAEGRELIDGLLAHATQPQYVYRHRWEVGDVVLWDNTRTLHRVLPHDGQHPRVMHRFTLEGIEPFRGASELATAHGAGPR
jgi:alpha-ketoglutarate-dependent taurine dioxygenase